MTTDDRLLLTDLERIEQAVRLARNNLAEYGDRLHPWEHRVLDELRRTQREMVDFRERLERRLNGQR